MRANQLMLGSLWYPNHRHCSAFTIVELLVALVIVSMLTATALLAVRFPLRLAEFELAVEQLHSMDALARSYAEKGQPVNLQLVPAGSMLTLTTSDGTSLASSQLSRHAKIHRVVVHNHPPSHNAVELRYERSGSPTFAALLGNPRDAQHWVVICGLSGEVYRFDKIQGDRIVSSLSVQTRNLFD